MKPWTITDAQKLCVQLEKRLRPRRWHIALTGSVLYGHPDKLVRTLPRDLDLLFYPNNDDHAHDETLHDLLAICGIKNVKGEPPKFRILDNNVYHREVAEVKTRDGRKVNFWRLDG